MPNHVYQHLTVKGPKAEIDRLLALVVTKDSALDIDTFFPMPLELRGTTSPADIVPDDQLATKMAENEVKRLKWGGMSCGRPISVSESADLIMRFGTNTWYDWANKHWGTKWGVYEVDDLWTVHNGTKATLMFQSAWSPASLIIKRLSTMFRSLLFTLDAADEGGGFVNTYIIVDGNETCIAHEWDSGDGIAVCENAGYSRDNEDDEEGK